MAIISSGQALLRERPQLEKKFTLLGGNEATGEKNLKGIAYDIRLNCLWIAGETNKLIYRVNPADMSVITTYNYPKDLHNGNGNLSSCYGICMEYETNRTKIVFLGKGNNVLQLVKVAVTEDVALIDLEVVDYFLVENNESIKWNDSYTGLTKKGFLYYSVGGNNGEVVYEMNESGQILQSFAVEQKSKGILFLNGHFYVPTLGSTFGFLNKYKPNFAASTMFKFQGIEPFSMIGFSGDLDSNKDTAWAVSGKTIYQYRILYYAFIVDGMPYSDIDLEVIKAGGEKTKEVIFKNIADIFALDGITLSIVNNLNSDADEMITLSRNNVQFGTSISFGDPLGIDGELTFWVKGAPPSNADSNGNPRVASIEVTCKVY